MTKSMVALLVGAALSGFVAGTTAMAQERSKDQSAKEADRKATEAQERSKHHPAKEAGKKATKAKLAKHCCKGRNDCKGQGGCGGTKGKNDCKGQGGCSTKTKCAGHPCK